MLSLTNKKDSVFDPYMGVGSAVIGAVKHGRKGLGCDIVPEYVETAGNDCICCALVFLRRAP
ncbi:MAG: site-specific DNA-methyltransferase [Pseudorhodoplanes sp.]|nr:site-specific DNA-methyltransferase [Pseudorhodoplanes sp.]